MTRSQCGNKVTRSSVKSGEINAAINYTVLRAYTPLHTMRLVFFFFFFARGPKSRDDGQLSSIKSV